MKKNYAVLGLGKSGKAAIEFLSQENYVSFWDDNEQSRNSIKTNENVSLKNFEDWDYKKLDAVMFSPGIPHEKPEPHRAAVLAKQNDVEIICDIEILTRNLPKGSKTIAITGTNGKSTTTALIYHILKECGKYAQIGGNFGIAALSLDTKKEDCVYVIEISSFQLDLLSKAVFDVAILLNITPDHMERYGSIEAYKNSKMRVFFGQKENQTAVICSDQDITKNVMRELRADKFSGKIVECNAADKIFKEHNFDNLKGEHNKQNIIAAINACRAIGLGEMEILSAIKTFKGLRHRQEIVAESDRVMFVNDSKATNADATEPALKTYVDCVWLAGGVQKEGGIESLKDYFSGVAAAVFYGQAEGEFAKTYSKNYSNFKVGFKFEDAVKEAYKQALELHEKNGKKIAILLSPACASFDEFKNYEERGDKFKALAEELLAEKLLAQKLLSEK